VSLAHRVLIEAFQQQAKYQDELKSIFDAVLDLKHSHHWHGEAHLAFQCQGWASAVDCIAAQLRKAMDPLPQMLDHFRVHVLPSNNDPEECVDPCVYCISDMAEWRAEFVTKLRNLQKLSAFLPH
jgi:hypothetical protein